MASKHLTLEQQNFVRLSFAGVDEARVVLGDVLHSQILPKDIVQKIQAKTILSSGPRKLKPEQKKLCCIPGPGVPDYKTFDITLLYKLIRNLCSSLQPSQGWGKEPRPTENNIGDDIERLRFFRNEMIGHVNSSSVPGYVFQSKWNELENIFKRIQGFLTKQGNTINLVERLESIKSTDFGWQDYDKCQIHLKLECIGLTDAPKLTLEGGERKTCGESACFVVIFGDEEMSNNWPITWQRIKGNITEQLDTGIKKYRGSSSLRLVIPKVSKEDEGEYRATVSREEKGAHIQIPSNTIYLTMTGDLPKLKMNAVSDKNKITICYNISTNDESSAVNRVVWSKDGEPLDENADKYSGGSLTHTYLTIHSPMSTDIGQYSCEVFNAVGSVKETINLDFPSASINDKHKRTAVVGDSVTITATIWSSPKLLSAKWQKSSHGTIDHFTDVDINDPRYFGSTADPEDPKLCIPKTTREDGIFYRLVVSNGLGQCESNTAFLKLVGDVPSVFVNHETCVSEQSIKLVCIISLYQKSPEVSRVLWTKDGREIDILGSGGKYMGGNIEDPSLTINAVNSNDKGEYQCCASNYVGSMWSESILLGPPTIEFDNPKVDDTHGTVTYNATIKSISLAMKAEWKVKEDLTGNYITIDISDPLYRGSTVSMPHPKLVRNGYRSDHHESYQLEVFNSIGSRKRNTEVHSTNIDDNNTEKLNLGNGDDGTESHDELVADESHDELVADVSESENFSSKVHSTNIDDNNTERRNLGNGDDGTESHDELVADVSESENFSSKVEDYAKDPEFQKRFQQYLEEGSVDVCPISQIIIVGENGVGKTTLLYRLQGRSQEEIDQIKSTRGIDYHTKKSGFIVLDRQFKLNKEEMSNLAVSPGSVLAGDRKADKIIEKDKKEEHVIEDKKGIKFIEDSKEDGKIEEDSTESVNSAMDTKDAQILKEEDTRSQENGTSTQVLPAKKTGVDEDTFSEKNHQTNTKEQVPPDKKESAGEEADTSQNNWAKNLTPTLERKLEDRQNIRMKLKNKEDRQNIRMKLKNKDAVVLNVLDFAGQGAYYASHQAHIRKDAIYVIVFDVSRSLAEIRMSADKTAYKAPAHDRTYLCDRPDTSFSCWSQEDYIHYWLNTIQVHGGNCENIIFVGTHEDSKRKGFESEYNKMMKKLKKLPKKICNICIDLSRFSGEDEKKLRNIKKFICEAVSNSKKKSFPAKWMEYESDFEDRKSKTPVIGIDDLLKIIDEKGAEMWDMEIHDMLRYFHDNGSILFFSMDRLREIIILDIQWFVDCFKHIITDEDHAKEEYGIVDTEIKEKWNCFLEIGLLDSSLYDHLLNAKAPNLPLEYRKILGEYQQKLGMMLFMKGFELPDNREIDGWYVPCVNTEEFQPDVTKYENDEASSILCFRFDDYLPQDLFGRMIVLCLSSKKWSPAGRRLYKEGAHLLYCSTDYEGNGYQLEVYLSTTRQIITVQIVDKKIQQGKGTIPERKCEEVVRTEIQNIIQDLLAMFYACSKTCKIGFLCSKGKGYKESSEQHFIAVDSRRKYCDGCKKLVGDEVKQASDFWNVSSVDDSTIPNKKDDGKGREEGQWILVCYHAYWTIRKQILLEFGTFYKSLRTKMLSTATTVEDSYLTKDQEAKLEILDSFVDIGLKLQHLCKTPKISNGNKEENIAEIKDIAHTLKKISLAFGDDNRHIRQHLFFSWTDNEDDIRHEDIPAMPEISLTVPDLEYGDDVKLEASADVNVSLFIWLKNNRKENRLEILRKESTSGQKRSDSYELLNFSKEDEGQYQVVVATEQTVRRRIFQLFPGNVPRAIRSWDYAARRRYEECAKKGTRTIHRARAMIVGCAGAGKTTLLKRLQKRSLDELKKVLSTVGLEVHEDLFEIIEGSGNLKDLSADTNKEGKQLLSILDFGGQYAYYACHQVYLRRRAFYLLVLNMAKAFDEKVGPSECEQEGTMFCDWTYGEYMLFWLKSVHTYCDNDAPVIIVGTHLDQTKGQDSNMLYNRILEYLQFDEQLKTHLDRKRCFVLGFKSDGSFVQDALSELEKCMVSIAKESRWKESIPTDWALTEVVLRELRRQGKRMISVAELSRMCFGEIKEKYTQINDILKFYHDIGVILYFDESSLADTVIIDVQWFVDAFKNIITDPNHVRDIVDNNRDWRSFYESGHILDSLLTTIWNIQHFEMNLFERSHEMSPRDHEMNLGKRNQNKANLLQYMQRLGLIAVGTDVHYIPCMNKRTFGMKEAIFFQSIQNKTSVLVFRFHFLPYFLYFRLIVACLTETNGEWIVFEDNGLCFYKNIACFVYKKDLVALAVNRYSIQLQVFQPRQGPIVKNVTLEIRDNIERLLNGLTSNFHKKVMYNIGYQCSMQEVFREHDDYFIEEREIYGKGKLICPRHGMINHHILSESALLGYWKRDVLVEVTDLDDLLDVDESTTLSEPELMKLNFKTFDKLTKIGRDALQIYFDRIFPPLDLASVLIHHKQSLQHGHYKFNPDQCTILFPADTSIPSSAAFNVTIMYKLLRNYGPDLPTPTNGWGKKPDIGHMLPTDDIERIRLYGNEVEHKTVTTSVMQKDEFKLKWEDLSQAILRLSNGSLKKDIMALRQQRS